MTGSAEPAGGSQASSAELSGQEELLWRSLGRITQLLPRRLEADMVRVRGLTMTEFGVLQNLSEAPDGRLRMSELAAAVGLSASRVTRLVDDLERRGWVDRDRDPVDARGAVASLTAEGEEQRRAARPQQILSARRHILDHVPPEVLHELGTVLHEIAQAASETRTSGPGAPSGP